MNIITIHQDGLGATESFFRSRYASTSTRFDLNQPDTMLIDSQRVSETVGVYEHGIWMVQVELCGCAGVSQPEEAFSGTKSVLVDCDHVHSQYLR